MSEHILSKKLSAWLFLPLLSLAGCATSGNPRDPFESVNRSIYGFNDVLDKAVLKPVAETYDMVVPDPLDQAITNFFSNLDDLVVIANDVLQLKGQQAGNDVGRFLLNSTVGFFGFVDVATAHGWEKNYEDFGQTLGYWGVGSGPYLVLPLFGPSSLRDAPGIVVDWGFDPRQYVHHTRTRNHLYAATVLDVIDVRADMLGAERMLDTAAVDPYSFMRDAYLQRREAFVNDGHIPAANQIGDDELFDDLDLGQPATPDAQPKD